MNDGGLYASVDLDADTLLCVPVLETPRDDVEPLLMLRTVIGVGLVMLAYSSVEHLVVSLGARQPWVVLRHGDLQAALARSGVQGICMDLPVVELGEQGIDV